MREILVIVEDVADGAIELKNAACSLGVVQVTAAVFGGSESDCAELAAHFPRVINFPAAVGEVWDAEFNTACLLPWVAAERPDLVLLLHSNNGLDLAPLLAAKCDRAMMVDCLSMQNREDGLAAVRTLYGGKVHARVVAKNSEQGYLATLRPGAFAAADEDDLATGAAFVNGVIESGAAPDDFISRRRYIETVAAEAGAVDISQAEILVAVGRGIEEEENLEIVQSLAKSLGAELACTRPIVDKSWLEKSRQVGTSGQTVKPKIYLTVGVSGSFQHLGGVKGGPLLIAINQDPAAPIFATADVGIVGDLFDLVPLLEEKIREHKG